MMVQVKSVEPVLGHGKLVSKVILLDEDSNELELIITDAAAHLMTKAIIDNRIRK